MDHDYFPTVKCVLANLSLVLISYKHDIAISNITIRKTATNRPEAIAGVMFKNNLLLVVL